MGHILFWCSLVAGTQAGKWEEMVFMTLLRLLLLWPGFTALMSSPLEEVGGELQVNGSCAVWDSAALAKYTELFNFKLFIILRKPDSPHLFIIIYLCWIFNRKQTTVPQWFCAFIQGMGSKFSYTVLKLLKLTVCVLFKLYQPSSSSQGDIDSTYFSSVTSGMALYRRMQARM